MQRLSEWGSGAAGTISRGCSSFAETVRGGCESAAVNARALPGQVAMSVAGACSSSAKAITTRLAGPRESVSGWGRWARDGVAAKTKPLRGLADWSDYFGHIAYALNTVCSFVFMYTIIA